MKHEKFIPELSTFLEYDTVSGSLTWAGSTAPRAQEGQEAGYTRPDGHRVITFRGCALPVAKVCWYMATGETVNYVIHINSDKSDFRFSNLKPVKSRTTLKTYKSNTSGFKGVFFDKNTQKYRACVSIDGKRHYFGYHQTAELAHQAIIECKQSLII